MKKIKDNVLVISILLMIFILITNFIMYLINLRFNYVMYYVISILYIVLVDILIYVSKKDIKSICIFSMIGILLMIVLLNIFVDKDKIIKIDNKEYIVKYKFNDDKTELYLYDKVNIFVRTEIRSYGIYDGVYEIVDKDEIINNENKKYYLRFYDDNGKAIKLKIVTIKLDNLDKVVIDTYYEKDYYSNDNNIENDNYLLLEELEVLYEKKIDDVTIRVSRFDYIMPQDMLVVVLKSNDGKNFSKVTSNPITVSLEPMFTFIDKDKGFIIRDGHIRLSDGIGMDVTLDGGITFVNANFEYENSNVSYIDIEDVPYIEGNVFKIHCSIYDINDTKDGYVTRDLFFISLDGINWKLEKNS